jgi:hypothetical protein
MATTYGMTTCTHQLHRGSEGIVPPWLQNTVTSREQLYLSHVHTNDVLHFIFNNISVKFKRKTR